jgi:hypothetical protein
MAQLKCPAGFSQGDTSSEYGYVVSVLIIGLWHAFAEPTSTQWVFGAWRGNKAAVATISADEVALLSALGRMYGADCNATVERATPELR